MSGAPHRAGFVSIVGRPNVGKSTLLNVLVGQRIAITAHQPQTTRTSVQGVLTTSDAQVVLVDTPGIHKSDSLFNQRMMHTVRDALAGVDLVAFVTDASRQITAEDEQAVSAIPKNKAALLVLNKIDRIEDKRLLLPLIEQYGTMFPFKESVPVSARKQDGVEELKRVIMEHLPEGPALFPEDYLTDQPARFLAAEIIRERILHAAKQEVPHAVAVLIDKWEEELNLTRIAATIHVEKPGQKAIIIGTGGEMLKKVGSEARHRLEELLGVKVFLSLFVKVKPRWREDPSFLGAMDWRSMVGSEER